MPSSSGPSTPTLTTPSPSTSEKHHGRQRPGAACLECRSKKLKCDGKQPQCAKCFASGLECTPTTQAPRGPKRGHLKILQNKIGMGCTTSPAAGSDETTSDSDRVRV